MNVPMTDAECRIATEALSEQLDRYASLIVRKGCAIKPGQQLLVRGPVERADFVRRVVAAAYAAGRHMTGGRERPCTWSTSTARKMSGNCRGRICPGWLKKRGQH